MNNDIPDTTKKLVDRLLFNTDVVIMDILNNRSFKQEFFGPNNLHFVIDHYIKENIVDNMSIF